MTWRRPYRTRAEIADHRRKIIIAHDVIGISFRNIAKYMGLPHAMVCNDYARGLKRPAKISKRNASRLDMPEGIRLVWFYHKPRSM